MDSEMSLQASSVYSQKGGQIVIFVSQVLDRVKRVSRVK